MAEPLPPYDVQELRADLHHLIQPIIGQMRMQAQGETHDSDRLYLALALVDHAAGHPPHRRVPDVRAARAAHGCGYFAAERPLAPLAESRPVAPDREAEPRCPRCGAKDNEDHYGYPCPAPPAEQAEPRCCSTIVYGYHLGRCPNAEKSAAQSAPDQGGNRP